MDHVDEIKKKIDVVDLVSSYLTLKKTGKNYKACCPFHNEKTPSFVVTPEKQIWYCFGCNQGGDIFNFVEKIEGIDFIGALNLLAERAGVIIDQRNFIKKGEKDRYFEIMEVANRFFSYLLNDHKTGLEAKKYLVEERRLDEKTIKEFSLGYAPDDQEILKKFLIKKGFSENEILKMGLVVKNSKGALIDKFRERIIFPLRNVSGKIVGFTGRTFRQPKNKNFIPPKYLNSPQTEIYDKSSILYGLDLAKEAIREKDLAIVVEGNIDVVASHQAGVKNVVASSGTALTNSQVAILSRYTINIAFCFDNDSAGQMAMKRALDITQFEEVNVKAIILKDAKDPDELIQKNKEEWATICLQPIPLIEFYYSLVLQKNSAGKSSENKKNIAKEFLPLIKNLGSEIERAHWVRKISNDLKVDEKFILTALEKAKEGFKNKTNNISDPKKDNKVQIPKELLLLSALILQPEKMDIFFKRLNADDFSDNQGKNIYNILFEWHNKDKESQNILDIDYIKNKLNLPSGEQTELELLFFLTFGFFEDLGEKEINDDIESLIDSIKKEKKEKRTKEIEIELSLLNKAEEKEKIKKLLKELQNLI